MTEDELRLKLQNENTLLRLELAVLRDQRAVVVDIDRLRRENLRLREEVGRAHFAVVRQYNIGQSSAKTDKGDAA